MNTVLTVSGLVLDIVGALIVARGLLRMTEKQAVDIGVARWAADGDEENKDLPLVQSFIQSARDTKIGATLLTLGFLLQIVGAVMK